MSVAIATMGMFNPPCDSNIEYNYVGGAIIPTKTEDSKKRLVVNVTSVSTHDKKQTPLKIVIKMLNNSGVL